MADQRQGHAVGQFLGRDLRLRIDDAKVALIGEIDEAQGVALAVVQRDEEIPGVHQVADHRVDARQHLVHVQLAAGQVGDAVERGLQFLAALALVYFPGQFARALLDAPLQFLARLLAHQRGEDVLGDEGQQGTVLVAVASGLVVALHHHRATHLVPGDHRHAQPIGAIRTAVRVADEPELLPQLRRWPHRRPAVADHRHAQAIGQSRDRNLLVRIDQRRILLIGEIAEAHAVAFGVVQRDEEILGIHQLADHRVHATQHLRHVQLAAGEVGDLVQRVLQPRGLRQLIDRNSLLGQFHRAGEPGGGERDEIAPCRRVRDRHAIGQRPIGEQHRLRAGPRIAQDAGDPQPLRVRQAGRDDLVGLLQRGIEQGDLGRRHRRVGPAMPQPRLAGGAPRVHTMRAKWQPNARSASRTTSAAIASSVAAANSAGTNPAFGAAPVPAPNSLRSPTSWMRLAISGISLVQRRAKPRERMETPRCPRWPDAERGETFAQPRVPALGPRQPGRWPAQAPRPDAAQAVLVRGTRTRWPRGPGDRGRPPLGRYQRRPPSRWRPAAQRPARARYPTKRPSRQTR